MATWPLMSGNFPWMELPKNLRLMASHYHQLMKLKFLPEKYTFPATTIIYGNKTAVIIWEIDPIVFLLDSSQATISFLNYFELLWKIAKP